MIKYIAVILLLLSMVIKAQINYTAVIDSFMRSEVDVNKFNGNILVAKSGNIIYQKPFGCRNYYTEEPLDNNSIFDVASISKQFTAVGILLLKDKGKLSLTDTLQKYFPELPYRNITIKHLLTHSSGLPDYIEIMQQKWDRKKIAFNNDVINIMSKEKVPVQFQPGEKWEYSNTGYMLLASIIEKVSGKSFNDYMKVNIFEPLGMKYSRACNTRRSNNEKIPDYAYGFIYSDSLKKYILPDSSAEYDAVRYLDGVQGDGTINSTTGDLYIWDRALKNHSLLSEATQKEMFAEQIPIFGGYAYYGYGIMINSDELGKSISHSGSWPGYTHYMIRYPGNDLTIIVLCNKITSPSTVAKGLAQILNDKPFEFSYVHKETAVDTSFIKKCTGKFFFPSSGPAELIIKENQLLLKIYGGRLIVCKPESKNKFFYNDPVNRSVATLEFTTDESENILKIFHTMNFVKTEIKKQ